jgi:hypothetical protein
MWPESAIFRYTTALPCDTRTLSTLTWGGFLGGWGGGGRRLGARRRRRLGGGGRGSGLPARGARRGRRCAAVCEPAARGAAHVRGGPPAGAAAAGGRGRSAPAWRGARAPRPHGGAPRARPRAAPRGPPAARARPYGRRVAGARPPGQRGGRAVRAGRLLALVSRPGPTPPRPLGARRPPEPRRIGRPHLDVALQSGVGVGGGAGELPCALAHPARPGARQPRHGLPRHGGPRAGESGASALGQHRGREGGGGDRHNKPRWGGGGGGERGMGGGEEEVCGTVNPYGGTERRGAGAGRPGGPVKDARPPGCAPGHPAAPAPSRLNPPYHTGPLKPRSRLTHPSPPRPTPPPPSGPRRGRLARGEARVALQN